MWQRMVKPMVRQVGVNAIFKNEFKMTTGIPLMSVTHNASVDCVIILTPIKRIQAN